jgi:cytochrome P450
MFTRIFQNLKLFNESVTSAENPQNIPGPRGLPLVGNVVQLQHGKLHEQLYQFAIHYGDLARLRFFDQTSYLISSPELIEQVMVDQREHVHRTIYSKFYGKHLAWLDGTPLGRPLMTHTCQRSSNGKPYLNSKYIRVNETLPTLIQTRLEEWVCSARHGKITLYPRLVRLSFDALSQILFGEPMPETFFRDFLTLTKGAHFHSQTGFPTPAPMFWLAWHRWHEAIGQKITTNQSTNESILNGHNTPQGSTLSALAAIIRANPPLKKQILISELAAMFAGGVHPVATALFSLIYTFNKYPDAAQDIMAEARYQRFLPENLSEASTQTPFLSQFIKETLRLYPPIAVLGRRVKADRSLKLRNYTLPEHTQLLISSWAMHRHPAYWNNPLRFDPKRFDNQPADFCYFPFGIENQACLGKQLALYLVRTLAWHLCHGTEVHLDTKMPLILQQSSGYLTPKYSWLADVGKVKTPPFTLQPKHQGTEPKLKVNPQFAQPPSAEKPSAETPSSALED